MLPRLFHFRLRTLFVAMTITAIALAVFVGYQHRQARIRLTARAQQTLTATFPKLHAGFKFATARDAVRPSLNSARRTIDTDLFFYWTNEVGVQTNDVHDACMFQVKEQSTDYAEVARRFEMTPPTVSTTEIENLVLKRFRSAFDPLGFTIAETRHEELSHGTRTTYTFIDANTGVEVDLLIANGPDGYYYVQGNSGLK